MAFASFRKFWRHPDSHWAVVADRDCQLLLSEPMTGVRRFFIDPWPDKYCHAMAMKACADIVTGCELVLMFDSDMMMTKPTELADLMVDGKPVIYYENWNDRTERLMARRVWAPASMRSTGRLLDRDYMVAPVWLFWASTFRAARRLVEEHTGLPFLQAVYSNKPYDWRNFSNHPVTFCDIENLALAARLTEQDKYQWIPIEQHGELPVCQHWSHADFGAAQPVLTKVLDQ